MGFELGAFSLQGLQAFCHALEAHADLFHGETRRLGHRPQLRRQVQLLPIELRDQVVHGGNLRGRAGLQLHQTIERLQGEAANLEVVRASAMIHVVAQDQNRHQHVPQAPRCTDLLRRCPHHRQSLSNLLHGVGVVHRSPQHSQPVGHPLHRHQREHLALHVTQQLWRTLETGQRVGLLGGGQDNRELFHVLASEAIPIQVLESSAHLLQGVRHATLSDGDVLGSLVVDKFDLLHCGCAEPAAGGHRRLAVVRVEHRTEVLEIQHSRHVGQAAAGFCTAQHLPPDRAWKLGLGEGLPVELAA
mmetsp:Transcript_33261/g.86242  ORF Transcript_33261/g.86242 Transcript_33261/m.86242 type:complete len:302 (-) Transcript_33261:613-1518(-)